MDVLSEGWFKMRSSLFLARVLVACAIGGVAHAEDQSSHYARSVVSPRAPAKPAWVLGGFKQTSYCQTNQRDVLEAEWRTSPECRMDGVTVSASNCTGVKPSGTVETRTCKQTTCSSFVTKEVNLSAGNMARGFGTGYVPDRNLLLKCQSEGVSVCLYVEGNGSSIGYYGSEVAETASPGNPKKVAYCS